MQPAKRRCHHSANARRTDLRWLPAALVAAHAHAGQRGLHGQGLRQAGEAVVVVEPADQHEVLQARPGGAAERQLQVQVAAGGGPAAGVLLLLVLLLLGPPGPHHEPHLLQGVAVRAQQREGLKHRLVSPLVHTHPEPAQTAVPATLGRPPEDVLVEADAEVRDDGVSRHAPRRRPRVVVGGGVLLIGVELEVEAGEVAHPLDHLQVAAGGRAQLQLLEAGRHVAKQLQGPVRVVLAVHVGELADGPQQGGRQQRVARQRLLPGAVAAQRAHVHRQHGRRVEQVARRGRGVILVVVVLLTVGVLPAPRQLRLLAAHHLGLQLLVARPPPLLGILRVVAVVRVSPAEQVKRVHILHARPRRLVGHLRPRAQLQLLRGGRLPQVHGGGALGLGRLQGDSGVTLQHDHDEVPGDQLRLVQRRVVRPQVEHDGGAPAAAPAPAAGGRPRARAVLAAQVEGHGAGRREVPEVLLDVLLEGWQPGARGERGLAQPQLALQDVAVQLREQRAHLLPGSSPRLEPLELLEPLLEVLQPLEDPQPR
ncbi:Sucrose transport protein SUC2 [Frankliniella fusca]|uniref:Sucrose transport protein SUC2 n=1 Tax=Frankliniella fusca TaxID=407009 RepID=A0AAE1HLW7_9NEOP|nr:Sucrose transport protein SUC2 [Frankliniella fusca]